MNKIMKRINKDNIKYEEDYLIKCDLEAVELGLFKDKVENGK